MRQDFAWGILRLTLYKLRDPYERFSSEKWTNRFDVNRPTGTKCDSLGLGQRQSTWQTKCGASWTKFKWKHDPVPNFIQSLRHPFQQGACHWAFNFCLSKDDKDWGWRLCLQCCPLIDQQSRLREKSVRLIYVPRVGWSRPDCMHRLGWDLNLR